MSDPINVMFDPQTNEIEGVFPGDQRKRERLKYWIKKAQGREVEATITHEMIEDPELHEVKKGKVRKKPPQIRQEILNKREARNVRAVRSQILQDTDWTQNADASVDKRAWGKYRQELKDLTKQEGFPNNVVWPIPPE